MTVIITHYSFHLEQTIFSLEIVDNNPLKQTLILQTDDVMFSAIKALNRETFENPKVEDSEDKLITNPNEILKTVANHFENNFKDINTPEIPSFIGKSKPLNHRK